MTQANLTEAQAHVIESLLNERARLEQALAACSAAIKEQAEMLQQVHGLPAGRPVLAVERGAWLVRVEPAADEPPME